MPGGLFCAVTTSLSYDGKTTVIYDGLGRVAQTTVKAGNYTTNTNYTYTAGATLSDASGKTSTSGLVASLTLAAGSWSYPYTYTYDANGNITKVVQSGVTTSYTYDALGQLTRVDDGMEGATWLYTYDQGGNILTKKKYALGVSSGTPVESKTFTYGNSSWKDQLTAVNGVAITYDAIGNPLNDGTWSYTWSNGRQLTRMTSVDKDVRFVYNENGLRVQKRVDGVATNYYLHGKNVVHMTRGSDELHFFYDAQNKPAVVVYNGTAYAYLKNLQGDIVAILNGSGNAVVSYVYDAWGRPVSKTGSMASTLGTLNPFRYRSYVYDEETGLYYLRSRYYNCDWCRFANLDLVLISKLLLCNIFAYGNNCPSNFVDADGLWGTNLILAFMKDDYAKQIVSHWIDGGGEPLHIENDARWDEYITSNTSVFTQIGDAAYAAFKRGETTFSVEGSSVVLSATGKGGFQTGYDLLNGSNINNGGFSFYGEISYVEENHYLITGVYIFNDRVDAEQKYIEDRVLAKVVPLFLDPGKGVDYDITIQGEFSYHLFY